MTIPTTAARLHDRALAAGWAVQVHTAPDWVAVVLRKDDTHIQAQWERGKFRNARCAHRPRRQDSPAVMPFRLSSRELTALVAGEAA